MVAVTVTLTLFLCCSEWSWQQWLWPWPRADEWRLGRVRCARRGFRPRILPSYVTWSAPYIRRLLVRHTTVFFLIFYMNWTDSDYKACSEKCALFWWMSYIQITCKLCRCIVCLHAFIVRGDLKFILFAISFNIKQLTFIWGVWFLKYTKSCVNYSPTLEWVIYVIATNNVM